MKILYVKAKNYIGIYQGTGLKELYIDFRKCKNRITMISGRNGGGKSTLLDLLNPYPDSNNCFIPKEAGEKEIAYMHNNITYILYFDHPVTAKGERAQTKAYIKKESENGFIEYNPTGNITSFKDILDVEFGLDPNFIVLSKMSTEDKGLVDKSPAERKKYVNTKIEYVETFNNIRKVLSKRSSVYRSLINNITSKIDAIGDEDSLTFTLKSIENRLEQLNQKKLNTTKTISDADAMINVLDPGLTIQQLYSSIRSDLDSIEFTISNYNTSIVGMTGVQTKDLPKSDYYIKMYSDNKDLLRKYESNIQRLENSITDILVAREEENRAIQLKTQRLTSLKSELNFEDIKKSMEIYKANIIKYEKFFSDIKIKNAISISKDEYVSGLHTLKAIKETIDGFKSYSNYQTILDSIDYIRANTNLVAMQRKNEVRIDNLSGTLDSLTSEHYHYITLLSKLSILDNRPKECKIDSCAFIKDSLDALSKDPKSNIDRLEKQIKEYENEKISLEQENIKIVECISAVNDINIIVRDIKNNSAILNKLPNGHIFSNYEEFLNRLYNGDSFEDINILYKYIGYANIFEEYKVAKDTLYKLETDYKIYESKNEVIEELSNDINDIIVKLNNITSKLEETNASISDYKHKVIELTKLQEKIDSIIEIYRKRDDIELKRIDSQSKLNAISSNMEKIQLYLKSIEINTIELENIEADIKPLEDDRDKIKYGLTMLKQYKIELEGFTEYYNLIEILSRYTTPAKKGIQNIFIRVYMNDTLNLANEILSFLFNGRMKLLPYNIGDNGEFAIPCISMHTGMVADDISSCSRSEKSMISMILGFVLLKQSSTMYNILRLDEIDEGLDVENRLNFIEILHKLLNVLEVEQCIMISHSSEHTGEVDLIKLEQTDIDTTMDIGNVIFSL